jgi:hypothetical protein
MVRWRRKGEDDAVFYTKEFENFNASLERFK